MRSGMDGEGVELDRGNEYGCLILLCYAHADKHRHAQTHAHAHAHAHAQIHRYLPTYLSSIPSSDIPIPHLIVVSIRTIMIHIV